MKKNPIEMLEIEEQLKKLYDKGYGDFIDLILSNESKVYTKKGRINKSGMCRILNIKPKQLEDMLEACRCILINTK